MFLLLYWQQATQSARTWHDYPWPWVSLTWLLYNLQKWCHRRWFRKFTVHFRPIRKEIVSSMYNNNSYYSDPDTSDDFWSLVYVLQGTIVVQASFAVCNFRFFQLIIGMINHLIQWYVDLLTFRAGNLSLRFPTVFAMASWGTMLAEQEEVVMRMVGKRRSYLKERLGAQRRFFWEQELASGELYTSAIVCFTEHFMRLTTLSSGYSKFFLERF